MTPKLYKAAEVCDIAQLQPYVLRSWEKEFPGIGILKADDSGRLYRQADLDQVLRIKQLVFGEGLTVSGARKRLESAEPIPVVRDDEVIEALSADARKRITTVRDGLRSLLQLLNNGNGAGNGQTTVRQQPPPSSARPVTHRGKAPARPKKAPAARSKSAAKSRGSARSRKRA